MTSEILPRRALQLGDLKHLTQARIALGRPGASVPTKAEQRFLMDHARARAAVWTEVDFDALAEKLKEAGFESVRVTSEAKDRAEYVRRPDLGRRLSRASQEALPAAGSDVALVIADGLSASAVEINALPVALELAKKLKAEGLSLGPVVLAENGRVAIGDPIGERLKAKVSLVLIGERPGLSAADSLGAYLTFDPRPGTPDSRRNCISNIRAGGLAAERAAEAIFRLAALMLKAKASGVALSAMESALANDPGPAEAG
ncbi:ethanolamine ammonia-lyase subunit EutC [Afifella sp. IM 167]|uniref:ethanolamine ammonia-lyase subunit EutC n=1 Tax=Afifella sp. IM 167 TaxID=2033586 RepID=UPI001CCF2177|nr:ethanolamine ammonia-lyase subunit EutC [Afifella sp. IM 167]MBZ8134307.1 ethanolamine ammonia-lyase [Afifella sp. IM 167]